jgi:Flp pilus assembly protein protease CpaA
MLVFAEAIAFSAFSFLAVYSDMKTRVIPNKLNYGFVLIAIGFASYSQSSLDYFLLILFSFAFAFVLYLLGAWAAGDAKFFAAATAFYPFFHAFHVLSFLSLFINAGVILAAYFLFVERRMPLARKIPLNKLREGMVSAEVLYLEGRKIVRWTPLVGFARMLLGKSFLPAGRRLVSLKASGVGKKEVKELKAAGVKYLLVRESVAFAPAIVAGFAVSLLWNIV